MRFLRSSFIAFIVSLLVLVGYGVDVSSDCCVRTASMQQVDHGKTSGDDHSKSKDNGGCQCVCHQTVPPISIVPNGGAGTLLIALDAVSHPDQFPPATEPVGIDYPPQLA